MHLSKVLFGFISLGVFTASVLLTGMSLAYKYGNNIPSTSASRSPQAIDLNSPEQVTSALKQEGATLNLYWPSSGMIATWIVEKLVPSYQAYIKQQYGIDMKVSVLATEGGDQAFFQKLQAYEQGNGDRHNFDIDVVRVVPSVELLEAGKKGWFFFVLPDYAKLLPNLANVNQPGLQSFTTNGKTYAIPVYQPTISFFYNKERVPNPPQSVQELLAWAKANPRRFTYEDPRGSSVSSGSMFLLTVMKTFGDLDNPDTNSQGFQFLKELQKYIYPQPPEYPAPLNSSQIMELMKRGDIWLVPFWNDFGLSVVRNQKLNFITNYFPKEGTPVRNTPIAIPKSAAHKIAALLFLNYALSDKVQRELAELTRQIPASISCGVWQDLPLATFNYNFSYIQSHTFAAFHSKQNLTDIKRVVEQFPALLNTPDQQGRSSKTQRQVKTPLPQPFADTVPVKQKAKQLMVLGDEQYQNGQWEPALESFRQALTIYQKIGDRQGEAASLNFIGLDYFVEGHFLEGFKSWQQSSAVYREIGDRAAERNVLLKIGAVYDNLGWYFQAQEFYQQSLAVGREMGNLETLFKQQTTQRESVSTHSCLGQHIQFPELSEVIGDALLRSGNFVEAAKTLLAVIKDLNPVRQNLSDPDKVSIFDAYHAGAYRILQEVLIAQGKVAAALEISEWGRARAFAELLASRLSSNPTAQILPLSVRQIQQIAKEQNATLVEYSIIYDRHKVLGKPQSRESELFIWVIKPTGEATFRRVDLKPLWQQNTSLTKLTLKSLAVVPAVPTSEQALTMPRQQLGTMAQNRHLRSDSLLAALVDSTRESIGIKGRGLGIVPLAQKGSPGDRLKQLHKILIQPIADLLPRDPNAHVIFIPQSSLFLVPFPALQDANGQYLIEKHTILTAPSIQVLSFTHQQRQRIGAIHQLPLQGKDALIVGNPTMPKVPPQIGEPPQQLPNLPGAAEEARSIAALLKTQAFTSDQATKQAILQGISTARIVHLATHGILDDVRGLESAIALAPSGKDDGLLTAEQILDLKLNAELVVLSACNTGRGKITGDGVIGLSRSLITAGVPSVIVSLWSVPDAPTAFLMTKFYQKLQQNPDKAQALRQAMLTTMKQHSNPRDWAAFTLIGEAN